MEDQLFTCALMSQRGSELISLYENYEFQFMKTFRLVKAIEDQLLTCALLSQCGAEPILLYETFGVEHGRCSRHDRAVENPLKTRCTRCITGLESYKI